MDKDPKGGQSKGVMGSGQQIIKKRDLKMNEKIKQWKRDPGHKHVVEERYLLRVFMYLSIYVSLCV